MTEVTTLCERCNKQFTYDQKPGYPRKYCPDCSAIKKAEYEAKNKGQQPISTPAVPQETKVSTAKHDVVINRTEKPHSYEFGRAGARHKIYYDDVAELTHQIGQLTAAGLFIDEKQFE